MAQFLQSSVPQVAASWQNRDKPTPGMVSRRHRLSTRDRTIIQTRPHRKTKNPPAADGLGFMESVRELLSALVTDDASCGGGGPKLSRRTTSHTLRIIFYPRDRALPLSLATD